MSLSSIHNPWDTAPQGSPRRGLLVALGLLGLGFLAMGHDATISLREAAAFAADAVEIEASASDGNWQWRIAYLSIGAIGALLLVVPGRPMHWRSPLGYAMGTVFMVCVLSMMWSVSPQLTARRLVVLTCCLIACLGVARHFSLFDICRFAWWYSLVALGIGVLAELSCGTLRPWAPEYRFSGTLHPNAQGIQLSLLIMSSLCLMRDWPKRRGLLGCVLLCGFAFLFLTKSRSALAACLAGSMAIGWVSLNPQWRRWFSGSLIAATVTGLVLMLANGIDTMGEFAKLALLGRADQADTLSGRTPLWEYLAADLAQRPWLGYGYNSFWTEDVLYDVHKTLQWPVAHAHNAYLDLMLSLGMIGLSVVLVTLLMGLARLIGRQRFAEDAAGGFFAGVAIFALVNGGTESLMILPYTFAPFVLACGLARVGWFGESSRQEVTATADVRLLTVPVTSVAESQLV